MPFTPYDAATHAISRARDLLAGAQTTGSSSRRDPATGKRVVRRAQLPAPVRADMRRLSVVMAVGALDTYMHRLVLERAYWHDPLPGALARLDVRFDQLLEQADATTVAARANPHGSRPRVGVKRQLRDRLLRETFQKFEAVSQALAMAGQSGQWAAIGAEFNPPLQAKAIRARLDAIVVRRNQIVHEGDYERLERPQTPRLQGVSPAEAKADIDFIAELIDAIHAVVS